MFPPRPARQGASRVAALAALAWLAIVGALLLPAAPASAGVYAIDPCGGSQTATYPAGAQFAFPVNGTRVTEDCFETALRYTNYEVSGSTGMRFAIPSTAPNARIASFSGAASLSGQSSGGCGDASLINGDNDTTVLKALFDYCGDGSNQNTTFAITLPAGNRPRSIYHRLTCTTICEFWGIGDPDVVASIQHLRVSIDDPTSPSAMWERTGLLAADVPQSGLKTLRFTAADADSGVKAVSMTAPGSGPIPLETVAGDCAPLRVTVCPPTRNYEKTIDTDRLTPGATYTVSVTITDHSGNVATTTSPSFRVAGGATPTPTPTPKPGATPVPTPTPTPTPTPIVISFSPTPTPVVVPTPTSTPSLSLSVLPAPSTLPTAPVVPDAPLVGGVPAPANGFTPSKVTVRDAPKTKPATKISKAYGEKIVLSGQLMHEGKPLAGVTVDVLQTVARSGARRTKLTSVSTDATGVYRYTLTATASATIEVAYPEHVGADDYSASRAVTLAVSAGVALTTNRASAPRGRPVKFSGTVKIDPFPSDRPRVTIQVRSAYGWQDVATLRTAASGAFKWSHAFRSTGVFRFRAKVLGQSNLGAVPSSSDATSLRIT